MPFAIAVEPEVLTSATGPVPIIANFISNAHKYPLKGGLIRIEIKLEQEDQVLRVIDEGSSINEKEVESVFSPYYRGKLADTSPV
ncbi:MAG: ATP-binding protein [Chloroflexi bacterium]|nr:ATP-binding protein [Chloroflexota bacterium]MBT7004872.1 ATP-binding protein [Chloroflexota bacterium]